MTRALPGVVFLLLAAMVVVTAVSGERSAVVYDLQLVIGTVILFQLLFVRDEEFHPGVLLLQVFAFAAAVRLAAVITVPHYIGVDILTHLDQFATSIKKQRSLAAIRGDKYWAAPLYHLYVVAVSLLGKTSFQFVVYALLETFMLGAGLFIYATAREFVAPRWAVFATTLFILSDEWTKWSLHLIPTSLAAAFYLAVFFLLIRGLRSKTSRNTLMLSFFLTAVALSHQVGAFITLSVLGSAFVVQLLLRFDFPYGDVRAKNVSSIVLFYGGFVTFLWSITPLNGQTFVTRMLLNLQRTVKSALGFGRIEPKNSIPTRFLPPEVAKTTPFEQFVQYIDYAGFLLLLAVAIVGFLYVLRRSNATHALLTLFVTAVVMSVFTLGLPLFGVNDFLPGRWYVFMYVPLVVAGAIGFAYLRQYLPERSAAATFVVFLLLFPAVMFLAHDATFDQPAFSSEQPRYSYTENELATAQTMSTHLNDNTPIRTDSPYTELFMRSHNQTAATMELMPNKQVSGEYVLYRKYDSEGAPYYHGTSKGKPFTWIKPISQDRVCTSDRSTVYASDNTRLCVK